ncbi:MAG: hypothetical protein WEB57_00105 [Pseudohongiellaceae bacterium]
MKSAVWPTLILLLLGACATTVTPENWPDSAPPYEHFVDTYRSDEANQAHQAEDDYLTWVRRFYEGRPGILGWNDITESVVQDMDRAQRSAVDDLGNRLGRRIAAEWAKANEVRRIDTAMLSLWGSIMVTAESPETRLEAMRAIDRDARALLDGELRSRQITEERYAEFDSFF